MQRYSPASSGTTRRQRSPFTPTPCTNTIEGPLPRSRYSMVPAGISIAPRSPSSRLTDMAVPERMPGGMSPDTRHADVVVIGAGITGLVAALELLNNGRGVVLLDRCHPEEVGGLAREAFGGMFMVDSPEQRRSGVKDSYELALDDWVGIADFEDADVWPRRWAEQYIARSRDDVGGWLREQGVWFFPMVNWAERGMYGDGNSVPRFHLTWGCGQGLIDAVWGKLQKHPRKDQLEVCFRTRVMELVEEDEGAVTGVRLEDDTEISANAVVIAAGGIGGNLDIVRKEWPPNM